MSSQSLNELAQSLKLSDQKNVFAKVVISYSTASKVKAITTGHMTAAGADGFIGIYEDELTCFDTTALGNKPKKERFRVKLKEITHHEIKKGFLGLNNQFNITFDKNHFKFYFRGKVRPIIEKIDQAIT